MVSMERLHILKVFSLVNPKHGVRKDFRKSLYATFVWFK